jgi:hypothetical protein
MALVCKTCGTHNAPDPGGDEGLYRCGYCGNPTLMRVVQAPQRNPADKTVAGAAIGATLGGLFLGPYGALAGALLGGAVGSKTQQ